MLSALVIWVFVNLCAVHAEQGSPTSYQAMSDRFFTMVREGKNSEGIDYLFSTNPSLQKLQDQANQLKAQFSSLNAIVGSYVSHTKLVETKVAGSYVYQHYFVAYQRQPVSVRIAYYKSGDNWGCYSLQFDTKLTDNINDESDRRIAME